MDSTCPHLSLVLTVNKEDLLVRSERVCNVCRKSEKLWACLQESCEFVGCGESIHDHSTKHYQKQKHAIAVNLNTFRIWCYACGKEVHLTSAFTPSEMKSLKKARQASLHDSLGNTAPKHVPDPPKQSEPVSTRSYDTDLNASPVGLRGLRNMGNTCYMNSALQAISNCPPVMNFFVREENDTIVEKKPSMARTYFHLMQDMWSVHQHRSIAPSGIHSTLKLINPSFRGYHQQDAQEFLRCFMDRLHEELKYIIPKWKYADELPENHHEEHTNAEEEPMDIDDERENTVPLPSARVSDPERDSVDSFTIISESQPSNNTQTVPSVSAASPHTRHVNSPTNNISQLHGTEQSFRQNEEPRIRKRMTKQQTKYQNHPNRPSKKPMYRYRSIVSEIFDGELRSSVQCLTCDQVSHTRETFQDLSLPIPGKDDLTRLHGTTGLRPVAAAAGSLAVIPGFKGPCSENSASWTGGLYSYAWDMWEWMKNWFMGPQVTLNDCLSAFFSADELKGDNMYSCNKCNKLRNGMKYCKLLQLPEVLCIHLKRFRHEYLMSYSSKISSPVSFPITGLDLRQYLAQDSPSTCTTYNLCSIIVHHGNAGGGHYTTYAKNVTDGNWYEFDDQFIAPVSESVVANAEAYVLFYQKSSAEVSRARERILQILNTNEHQNENSKNLLQFYISTGWLNKFLTFAEPGPIDNSDFLCRHAGLLPRVYDDWDRLVQQISEPMWQKLHERCGGGPAVTTLTRCLVCEEDYCCLQNRREEEHSTFRKLNTEPEPSSSSGRVYISLDWFREWEDFLNEKLPEPPGKIDNWPICYTNEGKHFLRKSSSHAPIQRRAWDYLISIYGGGPEVAPFVRTTSRSPSRKMKSDEAPSSPPTTMEQDGDARPGVSSSPPPTTMEQYGDTRPEVSSSPPPTKMKQEGDARPGVSSSPPPTTIEQDGDARPGVSSSPPPTTMEQDGDARPEVSSSPPPTTVKQDGDAQPEVFFSPPQTPMEQEGDSQPEVSPNPPPEENIPDI